jgi:hypothetical protein
MKGHEETALVELRTRALPSTCALALLIFGFAGLSALSLFVVAGLAVICSVVVALLAPHTPAGGSLAQAQKEGGISRRRES